MSRSGFKSVCVNPPGPCKPCDDVYRVWLTFFFFFSIGGLTELMGDLEGAMNAYEQALRHNQWSIPAMNAISCILRTKEQFAKAVEYLQNILKLDPTSGETWGSLGKNCSHSRAALRKPTNHDCRPLSSDDG